MTASDRRARGSLRTRDWLLVALTVSSGAVDAISYLALGKVFTAFMTGNFVFLGLVAAGPGTQDVASVLVSIVLFAVGVFVATLTVRPSDGQGVWPGQATAALGVTAVAQSCFLVVWVAVGGAPAGATINVLLGLFAFAMGAQTGAVLSFGLQGVFTTAATATISFLMRDAADRRRSEASDIRRYVGMLVGLFAGAVLGALLLVYVRVIAPVLPLIVTVVVIASAATRLRERGAVDTGKRRGGTTS